MAGPNGNGFNPASTPTGVNLAYTRFIFILPRQDGEAFAARVRQAGSVVARGFYNDFDADGARDVQPHETIQFLVSGPGHPGEPRAGAAAARYVAHVSGKYRPRLLDVEQELRRRLGDAAEIVAIEGAERAPRYTSVEMYAYANRPAAVRQPGRTAPNAFIVPLSKTAAWWAKSALDRHPFFYPHVDSHSGAPVKGHARAAEAGIPVVFRRYYHNPDGYQRPEEFDFIAYFECEDAHVETFERIYQALRDPSQNPEWELVVEGPVWRGRRVLRW